MGGCSVDPSSEASDFLNAMSFCHVDVAKEKLEGGASPNEPLFTGDTAMVEFAFGAASRERFPGCPDVLELLLEHGGDATAPSKEGDPLIAGAIHGHESIVVSLLLEAGSLPCGPLSSRAQLSHGHATVEALVASGDGFDVPDAVVAAINHC